MNRHVMLPGKATRPASSDVASTRDAPIPEHACAPGVDPGHCQTCGERLRSPEQKARALREQLEDPERRWTLRAQGSARAFRGPLSEAMLEAALWARQARDVLVLGVDSGETFRVVA